VTDKTNEVGQPATPLAKQNVPVPAGVQVERPQTVRSPNAVGGEVRPSDYSKSKS
jgi:hypothetical protein